MQNFNTNQTRHFYVASSVSEISGYATDSAVSGMSNGDLKLMKAADKSYVAFLYKNADGLITRSDTIDPKKIVSLKNTDVADLATKLMAHTITIDGITMSNDYVGKVFTLSVKTLGLVDYDASDGITITASVTGDATNTASASAFYKDMAMAIAKALPKFDKQYPLFKVFVGTTEVTAATTTISGTATSIILVEAAQKYVRGKLSGEPVPFVVSSRLKLNNYEDIPWAKDVTAASNITGNTTVSPAYALADLEYFALGERGDMYRGFNFPNDYTPTYMINPTASLSGTRIITIEYYWNGNAENVQKSPRMIQIACPTAGATTIYNAIDEIINPSKESTAPTS